MLSLVVLSAGGDDKKTAGWSLDTLPCGKQAPVVVEFKLDGEQYFGDEQYKERMRI